MTQNTATVIPPSEAIPSLADIGFFERRALSSAFRNWEGASAELRAAPIADLCRAAMQVQSPAARKEIAFDVCNLVGREILSNPETQALAGSAYAPVAAQSGDARQELVQALIPAAGAVEESRSELAVFMIGEALKGGPIDQGTLVEAVRLIRGKLEHRSDDMRYQAVHALGKIASALNAEQNPERTQIVRDLARMLDDRDVFVRRGAETYLSRLQDSLEDQGTRARCRAKREEYHREHGNDDEIVKRELSEATIGAFFPRLQPR